MKLTVPSMVTGLLVVIVFSLSQSSRLSWANDAGSSLTSEQSRQYQPEVDPQNVVPTSSPKIPSGGMQPEGCLSPADTSYLSSSESSTDSSYTSSSESSADSYYSSLSESSTDSSYSSTSEGYSESGSSVETSQYDVTASGSESATGTYGETASSYETSFATENSAEGSQADYSTGLEMPEASAAQVYESSEALQRSPEFLTRVMPEEAETASLDSQPVNETEEIDRRAIETLRTNRASQERNQSTMEAQNNVDRAPGAEPAGSAQNPPDIRYRADGTTSVTYYGLNSSYFREEIYQGQVDLSLLQSGQVDEPIQITIYRGRPTAFSQETYDPEKRQRVLQTFDDYNDGTLVREETCRYNDAGLITSKAVRHFYRGITIAEEKIDSFYNDNRLLIREEKTILVDETQIGLGVRNETVFYGYMDSTQEALSKLRAVEGYDHVANVRPREGTQALSEQRTYEGLFSDESEAIKMKEEIEFSGHRTSKLESIQGVFYEETQTQTINGTEQTTRRFLDRSRQLVKEIKPDDRATLNGDLTTSYYIYDSDGRLSEVRVYAGELNDVSAPGDTSSLLLVDHYQSSFTGENALAYTDRYLNGQTSADSRTYYALSGLYDENSNRIPLKDAAVFYENSDQGRDDDKLVVYRYNRSDPSGVSQDSYAPAANRIGDANCQIFVYDGGQAAADAFLARHTLYNFAYPLEQSFQSLPLFAPNKLSSQTPFLVTEGNNTLRFMDFSYNIPDPAAHDINKLITVERLTEHLQVNGITYNFISATQGRFEPHNPEQKANVPDYDFAYQVSEISNLSGEAPPSNALFQFVRNGERPGELITVSYIIY